MNYNGKKKVGLMIIGGLKNFENNLHQLEKFINYIKNDFDVSIFCYLSKMSYYQNWYKNRIKNKFNKNVKDEDHSKNDLIIKNLFDKINLSYEIKYYNSQEDLNLQDIDYNIKTISKDNTIAYQIFLELLCSEMVFKYENNNDIKFDYIIKTRPDNIYRIMNYKQLMNEYNFIYKRDVFYMSSREYFDFILKKKDLLNFTVNPYYELLKPIISKYYNNKLTGEFINHHLNELVLYFYNKNSIFRNNLFTDIAYKYGF